MKKILKRLKGALHKKSQEPLQGLESAPFDDSHTEVNDTLEGSHKFSITLTRIIKDLRSKLPTNSENEETGITNSTGTRLRKLGANLGENTLFVLNPKRFVSFYSNPENKDKINSAFRVGLAVISIHFAAAITAEILTGFFPEPSARKQTIRSARKSAQGNSSDLSAFVNRNLFSSKGLSPEYIKKAPPKIAQPKKYLGKCTVDEASQSSLPYKLVGTIILKNEKRTVVAIMSQSQNKVIPLRIGESFEDKIQIRDAQRLKVAFTNLQSQTCEFLEIKINAKKLKTGMPETATKKKQSSKGGIVSTEPNKFQIDRSVLSSAKSNIGEILTQALAIPVEDGEGNIMGFRLTQIVPDSIYEQLGLKNEDEICGVNGTPMTQVEQAIEVFSNMDDLANLDLCVRRNGREMSMNYQIN